MVHNAFDDICIVKESLVRIGSAIAPWDSLVIVGCIDGSIRIYGAPEPQASDEEEEEGANTRIHYVLRRTVVGFAKKVVTQMDVVDARGGMLITLAEAVAVHSLPELEPVAYLQKTKGASLFAWDEQRGLLCVAKHKRLLLYRHDGSRDFTEVKELSVPDVVKTMVWSRDSLCLGIKREYIFVNITSGTTTDIFPCGRIAPPLVVSLPRGELLLSKDNIGVFVDQFGKVTQQGALSWSEAPLSVVAHPPYVLARLSRFIEVRSLREPYGLVQMIQLRDIQLLQSSDFGLLAASETSVFKLVPVSIGVQIVQLAASGNFDDALDLCKLLPPEDAALRTSKEDAIHIRYGQFLFSRGQYAEALQHFAMSSLSLSTILSLFPSINLPKFCANGDSKDLQNFGDSEIDAAAGHANATNEQNEKSKPSTIALAALATFLMNKRGSIVDRAEAQDASDAVAELVETNAGRKSNKYSNSTATYRKPQAPDPRAVASILDTSLIQALLLTNQSAMAIQLLKGPNYCDVEACEEMMMAGGHFKELLQLYHFNKMHREALQLLTRLVETPESIPSSHSEQFGPESIMEYLQPLGTQDPYLILEFSTLILKVSPQQAMTLFTSTNPPLPANLVLSKLKKHCPELQTVYMEEMLRHDPSSLPPDLQNELVRLYLSHVVEERAELQAQGKWQERHYTETRKKLLAAIENFTAYNPQEIFRRLPEDGLYEERAFLFGRMKQHQLALSIYVHKLHDPEMALAYCDRVFQSATLGNKNIPLLNVPADQEGANVYSTLLEIYLKPRSSIKEFNMSIGRLGLSKSRADRAGAGHKVKGHVVRKITQIEEAQSFSGNDSTAESGRSDTEETISGRAVVEGVMLNEAIHLLSSRWDRFDGAQVLQMLPSDAKLKDLLPFLEPLLRRSTERSRNASVIRRVEYSDNVEVRHELLQCRKRAVKVTNERLCSICRKKIGSSVFAAYPNGALAHFVCYSVLKGANKISGP